MFSKIKLLISVYLILLTNISFAQPEPGDIFRNYIWTTPEESGFEFLRVIGDGDYREPVNFAEVYPKECIENGWLKFPFTIDLSDAVEAEIQVEKLLSHDGTRGLSVKINNSDWFEFPEPEGIPEPQYDYLYHNYPVVKIPLEFIREQENLLRFKVDGIQRFNMPQNILYGIHLRIYYSEKKKHSNAEITGIAESGKIGDNVELKLSNIQGKISKANFVGYYDGLNFETDGNYRQWHYTYIRGAMRHQIGYSENEPFHITWQTLWIPDQTEPFKIAAIIEDESGISYFIPPVENLTLERDYFVELCRPFNQPKMWATREQVFEENFQLYGDPADADEFQLVWSTWSPGYMNGIYLNDWLVFISEGCNYCPGLHRVTLDSKYMLNKGINSLKTGLTPRIKGNMVHGAEILYPGIMVLVKYPKTIIHDDQH